MTVDAGPGEWGRPLYERVLDVLDVRDGTQLLDVGCGAGRLCRLAADRGAQVTGVDADPSRLREVSVLVPSARLHRARLPALGLPDGQAGAVSCVQVLMHVSNPLAALRELARVARPGAPVAVTVWGPPELCAVGQFGEALAPILGPPPWATGRRSAGPPPLDADGRLAKLVILAGLTVRLAEDVRCDFDYPDERALLAGLYAADLGRRATALAGRQPVRRAVLRAASHCRRPDGGYRLGNTFRLVVGHA